MWNKNSISWRLILHISILVLIFRIISLGSLYYSVHQNDIAMRNFILAEHAQTIASFLEIDDTGSRKGQLIFEIPDVIKERYDGTEHYQYVIRDKAGKILFSDIKTAPDRPPPIWPLSNDTDYFEFDDTKGGHYFGSSYVRFVGHNPYLVQVATSQGTILRSLPRTLATSLVSNMSFQNILSYILLITVVYWTVRRSLHGLNQVSADASKISVSSPDFRLGTTNLPEEIRPLVIAFNKALSRLEEGIKFERDFIASASHELRTPLSIVRCHAERIQDKEIATPLLKDIDSLSRMMKQLLDKAKLSGVQRNNFERIDLRHVVQAVCTDMGPLLIAEGRALEVTDTNMPMMILGDEWAIYRALANLIENAINHTPKKTGIEINIKDFSISVRDHGSGIPPENRDKIFQSFWRQDVAKTHTSGLGLAIVKKTMDIHDGTVTVENAPDGGAIFTLKFSKAAHIPSW